MSYNNDINLTPQFYNNPIFNSILMSILFSQNSQKLLLNHFESSTKLNEFQSIIKNILVHNFKNKENIQKLFLKLEPFNLFFNYNIITFIKNYLNKKKIKSFNFKNIDSTYFDWNEYFIIDFYRSIGLNCLDIAYNKDKIYLNLYNNLKWNIEKIDDKKYIFKSSFDDDSINIQKKINETLSILTSKPDVIILFNDKINNSVTSNYHDNISKSYSNIYDTTNYNDINFDCFKDYDNEFIFMDEKYILDSVLLSPLNKINTYTVGITSKNEKYVFNTWPLDTQKSFVPCSLKKFNWDIKKFENFCFNPTICNLNLYDDITDINDLCFNFTEGNRTLIYIKESKIKDVNTDFINDYINKIYPNDNIEIPDIIEKIKEIKSLTIKDLIKEINKFISSDKQLIYNKDDSKKYKKKILEKILFDYLIKNFYKNKESTQNSKQIENSELENIETPIISTENIELKSIENPIDSKNDIIGGNNYSKKFLISQLQNLKKNKNIKINGISNLPKSALIYLYLKFI